MSEITKTEVKKEVNKEIEVYMNSNAFKTKIEKIVRDRVKNEKELENRIVDITKNVITQLYKTLWTKRSFWRETLKNQAT
jgi:metal-dependent hydrolase (beta-lactamase superfamily II)